MHKMNEVKPGELAQRRVLARVLSHSEDLRLVQGGGYEPTFDFIITAPPPGRDLSSPTSEGEIEI